MKSLYEKIKRGKEAIARAQAEGRDTTEWEKHVGRLEEKKAIQEFQYLCDKVATLSYNGNQEKLKAFWAEADKINAMADGVVEGRANFDEWKALVGKWIISMGLPLKCSRCGKSHDEVVVLLDVAYFDGEITVCPKCYKRLD